MKLKLPLFAVLLCSMFNCIKAQDTIHLDQKRIPLLIDYKCDMLVDAKGKYDSASIIHAKEFEKNEKKIPVFLLKDNNIWTRVSIENKAEDSTLYFVLTSSNIALLELYKMENGHLRLMGKDGNSIPFDRYYIDNVNFNFKIFVPRDSVATYYLHVQSPHPVELPIVIHDEQSLHRSNILQVLIMGLYCGIILSILLYNLFLYIAVKDSSYLYYVLYLVFLLIAQATYSGWAFKFMWPSHPSLNTYAVVVTSSLPGIPALLFALIFLHVKKYSRYLHPLFYIAAIVYVCILVGCFWIPLNISYQLLNYVGFVSGLLALVTSFYIARKGYRPAYYYFIAWFIFAIGRQVASLRNLGVVPNTFLTQYILYIGSAVEAIFLSLALADRINILQKERNDSQLEALKMSQENENLIKEQNLILEGRVAERTEELLATNEQLSEALDELKDAQTQLVDAEKMASIGQLTAGIAHEINNPINFVKSNIKPLKLDIAELVQVIEKYDSLNVPRENELHKQIVEIEDFKKEIDLDFIKTELQHLIKGIEDGAERTAEIVRGLRTFSRVDEGELKTVNVHDGLNSTLVLLKNSMPFYIQVDKHFEANGNIECHPGKMNQVFMNILNNGIQAIVAKKEKENIEYITILTRDIGDSIEISIKDSGVGMTDVVKQKIFEPFFTTKDVGEGTGLGMAIVFKIVETHHGKISIVSEPGKGAEFIIHLPHTQPMAS
ncbi:MAG: sensor histidine kinase [Filimonas sp.]|nr:sensor histidine kinase [Filimonas sp.]